MVLQNLVTFPYRVQFILSGSFISKTSLLENAPYGVCAWNKKKAVIGLYFKKAKWNKATILKTYAFSFRIKLNSVSILNVCSDIAVMCSMIDEELTYPWGAVMCLWHAFFNVNHGRINAYIEEEVQRRLHKLNLLNGSNNMELSLSSESFKVRTLHHHFINWWIY